MKTDLDNNSDILLESAHTPDIGLDKLDQPPFFDARTLIDTKMRTMHATK